jgi:hypothetical protein
MTIELNPIASGYSTTKINTNFQKVEDEFNTNVLRRNGLAEGEANQMEVPLDMNSFDILNVNNLDAQGFSIKGQSVDGFVQTAEEAATAASLSETNAGVSETNAAASAVRAEVAADSSDAVVLRADLADAVDPLKGAALVGYEGGTVASELAEIANVSRTFTTVAAMTSATPLATTGDAVTFSVGMVVNILDYATGSNSGLLTGRIVAGGTGTADGGSYITLANGTQWKQNFKEESISVKQFGAIGNGTTDDTAAFANALAYSPSKVHVVGGNAGFVIDSTLDIPPFKSLEGAYTFIDPRNGLDFNSGYPSKILLNSAAKIILNESASLRGLPIIRKGLVMPVNAAGVALFAGLAVETRASTSGQYVGHCAIVGFSQAVATSTLANTEQLRCEYLNIDCSNGILGDSILDICYIENVHCWPTASVGLVGVVDADLQRSGAAFKFDNGGDWNKITNCFSYGYSRGFVISNCNDVTLIGCGADYTPSQTALPIGFTITGESAAATLIGCQAAGQNIGYGFSTTSPFNHAQMIGCSAIASDSHGVLNDSAKLFITGGRFVGSAGAGVTPNNIGPTILNEVSFQDVVGNAINSQSTAHVVRHTGCTFQNITGSRVINPYRAIIASSASVVLNSEDLLFEITGTTSFGSLSRAADYAGKIVTLTFTGVLTVFDGGGNMKLAGNFNTAAGSSLTLISDGIVFIEMSRSTN